MFYLDLIAISSRHVFSKNVEQTHYGAVYRENIYNTRRRACDFVYAADYSYMIQQNIIIYISFSNNYKMLVFWMV